MDRVNTNYRAIEFLTSSPSLKQCPEDTGCEVAFAGRSNAGKSSAINTLTGIRGLARTSKTPGRTQLINFFQLDGKKRLVDLPGYGYAKVPRAMKQQWDLHLAEYLQQRRCLAGLILLMDIRHPLQDYDQQMLNWAKTAGLPVHVLMTKADKLKRGATQASLLSVTSKLAALDPAADWFSVQTFSSLKKIGIEDLKATLDHWLNHELSEPEDPLTAIE